MSLIRELRNEYIPLYLAKNEVARFMYRDFLISSDHPALVDKLYDDLPEGGVEKIGRMAALLWRYERYLNNRWGRLSKYEILTILTSVYRNPMLNVAVGGEEESLHLSVDAIDFCLTDNNYLYDLYEFIKNATRDWSELILYEKKPGVYNRIHLGLWKPDKEPFAKINK